MTPLRMKVTALNVMRICPQVLYTHVIPAVNTFVMSVKLCVLSVTTSSARIAITPVRTALHWYVSHTTLVILRANFICVLIAVINSMSGETKEYKMNK